MRPGAPGRWRMARKCRDCPFQTKGPGLRLRRTLRRWPQILRELRAGTYFMCHKTTRETGNGTNLLCAGALAYQHERGVTSNYERVCLALDYFRKCREATP